ncbi:MAG TPA: carboxymuconolactone decarboxylase family protein [Nitrospirota bacterium]
MDTKIKELIAVGASITANCQPCLKYHVSSALEQGASEQEIMEAIEVGKTVRKGAMAKMNAYAADIFKEAGSAAVAQEKECGCTGNNKS